MDFKLATSLEDSVMVIVEHLQMDLNLEDTEVMDLDSLLLGCHHSSWNYTQ